MLKSALCLFSICEVQKWVNRNTQDLIKDLAAGTREHEISGMCCSLFIAVRAVWRHAVHY